MPLFQRTIAAASVAITLLNGTIVFAEETANPDHVLATVNGTEITLGHVITLRADLPAQYNQFPPALLFQGILDQLVRQTLLMQSHEGKLSRAGRLLLENEERAIVSAEVTSTVIGADIDEDALMALYKEQYANGAQKTEYRASHILVETREEADALIVELEGGTDFAKLAEEKSTGPSSAVGGDLGWFGEGDLVTPFFDAVVALKPDEVSPPVQTDFGWHVIKFVESRATEAPEFDAVKGQLADELQQSLLEEHVAKLTKLAKIERADLSDFDPETVNQLELLEK